MDRLEIELEIEKDWTALNGVSNSSPEYLDLVNIIERIIRNSASALINGSVNSVARSIMSSLAHKHGLRPESLFP